jgi:hypothetical protein
VEPSGFLDTDTKKETGLTNGATKSLEPKKWFYQFATPISKIVRREIYF